MCVMKSISKSLLCIASVLLTGCAYEIDYDSSPRVEN